MPEFSGKVVLVTGSSNGIGRSTVILFAKEGAKVTITGRNAGRVEETKQQIVELGVSSENINSEIGDLTSEEFQNQLVESTIKKFGKIDIFVNCAGAAIPDNLGKSGIDQNLNTFDQIFNVNVRSIVGLTQKVRPFLAASKGEIVNVSSVVAGPQAQPQGLYYGMSKAALDQLTRSLAINLISEGIRVNSVSPGAVDTGFLEATVISETLSKKIFNFYGSHKECIPVGSVAKPEDIAEIIMFLADRKKSGYILGQSIVADGGSTLIMGANVYDIGKILSEN